jgi:hypothetical protein
MAPRVEWTDPANPGSLWGSARAVRNPAYTPHIGYVSRGLYERFYGDTVNNISTWLDERRAC